jgi:hypothetical protein
MVGSSISRVRSAVRLRVDDDILLDRDDAFDAVQDDMQQAFPNKECLSLCLRRFCRQRAA